ncbi:4067_t:CDS:2 [Cetraspora pellucida]|uniref:4067_t:CDS:1 n=1 Tax=Cetraspora pellucida TaxID=1433469 RepID=A0A9N9NFB8_9GLOM|nr:4067_t:CDS:2 [Cetraspora pellucida]
MAQAITKVINKMQYRVASMRTIGKYHKSFIDFLIVFMSISTLATCWLTANFAGPTIQFLQYKRNKPDKNYNIYGINISSFSDIVTIWHKAYNYNGPTICAKDQTKVAELIKVCKHQQKWIKCILINSITISTTMIFKELHNKINSFKKATYITVYALLACISEIPPVVISVIPSDQKKIIELNYYNNNLVIKGLYYASAMTIGLYFDDATLDKNWLGEIYSKSPVFSQKLILKSILKENSEVYSGLANDILNPKNKQSDKLAKRFFLSTVLKAEEKFNLLAKEELDLSESDFNKLSELNELLTKHQQ